MRPWYMPPSNEVPFPPRRAKCQSRRSPSRGRALRMRRIRDAIKHGPGSRWRYDSDDGHDRAWRAGDSAHLRKVGGELSMAAISPLIRLMAMGLGDPCLKPSFIGISMPPRSDRACRRPRPPRPFTMRGRSRELATAIIPTARLPWSTIAKARAGGHGAGIWSEKGASPSRRGGKGTGFTTGAENF